MNAESLTAGRYPLCRGHLLSRSHGAISLIPVQISPFSPIDIGTDAISSCRLSTHPRFCRPHLSSPYPEELGSVFEVADLHHGCFLANGFSFATLSRRAASSHSKVRLQRLLAHSRSRSNPKKLPEISRQQTHLGRRVAYKYFLFSCGAAPLAEMMRTTSPHWYYFFSTVVQFSVGSPEPWL